MEKDNPCYFCHGGCCRNYVLTIQIWDAYRIVKNTNYHFDDFVLYMNHELANVPVESHEYLLQFSDNPFVYFSMNLKREKSKLIDGPKCVFLNEELRGQEEFPENISSTHLGRKIKSYCSIYEHRPMMCSIYPFSWNGANFIQKSRDINDNFCPDDWKNYSINNQNQIEILKNNSMSQFIISAEANLLRKWNKTTKDRNSFEEFVINYFDNLFIKNDAE
jgi:Fe-S-cluster containining protein